MQLDIKYIRNEFLLFWKHFFGRLFHIKYAKIALFVDCENINNIAFIKMAFENLEKIGHVASKQFYGHFTMHHHFLASIIEKNNGKMIELPINKWKNYADTLIIIDVMETLLYRPDITHIAIVSNDQDFTLLTDAIRKHKRHSIALTTFDSLSKNKFDIFIHLQDFDIPDSEKYDADTQKIIYVLTRDKTPSGWVDYKAAIQALREFAFKKDWEQICTKIVLEGNIIFAKTNIEGKITALRLQTAQDEQEYKDIIRDIVLKHNKRHAKAANSSVTIKRIRSEVKTLGYRNILTHDKIKEIALLYPEELIFNKNGNWIKVVCG
ncbi:hypothetical protein BKN38_04820 [Helicobacter sp. CLO-3]|uniref:NYN domain-containing protein n=1 Tax=unclassified Helicobacter TaxID=2593540 RepID=UPI0008059B6C|nr:MULTISPECIES: NYN domain-containing protein [unclassified Helicobacter]OBV28911.1 hypothetical protein BA723_07500 [Helicobacter sp. CLO-3]OHU83912.1 hypothetical protein BKN38_04820 [Helicobacter sp. CLO-3]